jgi:tRNA A-37 threonylcarbamoyl transferase component Bud32
MEAAAEAALLAAARAALAARPGRVAVFTHDGQRCVAKRLAAQSRRPLQVAFLRWLARRVTGQSLPHDSLALASAARSMDYEAQRLRTLAAAGLPVPRVLALCAEFFVLEHCGEVVASQLEAWDAPRWRSELPRLAAGLGAFHRAGHWHGGAQIKNLTLLDGRSTRIDFEENFGDSLPLPVTQAVDLAIFLNSVALAGPIDATESRRLLPELLDRYRTENPDAALVAAMRRALPWLRALAWLTTPLARWSKKGHRRLRLLVDVLDRHLPPP